MPPGEFRDHELIAYFLLADDEFAHLANDLVERFNQQRARRFVVDSGAGVFLRRSGTGGGACGHDGIGTEDVRSRNKKAVRQELRRTASNGCGKSTRERL